ncbi:hypothetical protein [Laceyella tengchongensis]|jgi:hypothetical protein|uniref:hypothetical protein n=1 Tax=Laceyella tengchongensis TaxID=574699 RepID=UPI00188FD861
MIKNHTLSKFILISVILAALSVLIGIVIGQINLGPTEDPSQTLSSYLENYIVNYLVTMVIFLIPLIIVKYLFKISDWTIIITFHICFILFFWVVGIPCLATNSCRYVIEEQNILNRVVILLSDLFSKII